MFLTLLFFFFFREVKDRTHPRYVKCNKEQENKTQDEDQGDERLFLLVLNTLRTKVG